MRERNKDIAVCIICKEPFLCHRSLRVHRKKTLLGYECMTPIELKTAFYKDDDVWYLHPAARQ